MLQSVQHRVAFGHLGILNGKKATAFPGFEKDLKHGAEVLTADRQSGDRWQYYNGKRHGGVPLNSDLNLSDC